MSQYVSRRDLNGLTTPPGAPLTSASVVMAAPATAGSYELRYFRNDSEVLFAMRPVTVVENQAPQVTAISNRSDASGVAVTAPVAASDPDGGYAAAVQAALPVAYWRFNESSGTTAVDSSGQGRTATYVGGVTLAASGALGDATTAVTLNGAGAHIAAPNLDLTSSFTLEAWVYYTGPGAIGDTTYGTLFGYAGDRRILLYNNGALLSEVGGESWFASALVPTNTWAHVVYRYEAGANQQAFFINGAPAGTDTPTTPPTWNAAFRLGDYDGTNFLFKGHLDEAAVYGTALSAAQIAAHYAGQTLSYSATGLPPGLSIDPVTGLITGTPTTAGGYSVTVLVTDGLSTTLTAFTWTVT
jgi:hypothetical protein